MKTGNRPKNGNLTLTHARQVEILGRLVGLCDQGWEYSAKLQSSGFDSFLAWQNFESCFCEPADIAMHRLYATEVAKLFVGTPDGAPLYFVGGERGYRSPLVEQLRAERDASNGMSFDEIPESEFWRRELDPCSRRRVRRELVDPSLGQRLLKERDLDRWRRREAEISRHATGYGRDVDFTAVNFARLLPELFRLHLAPLGFEKDVHRSRPHYPVYSKPLTPFWNLCWSLKTDRALRFMPIISAESMRPAVTFDLCLYVRAKNRGGMIDIPLGFEWLDTMMIRYARIVSGFGWAYSRFESFDDLETILKAHVRLYKLVADFIEPTLCDALQAEGPSKESK